MESSTMTPVGARAVDAQTVAEAFRRTAANHPDVVAVRTADDNVSLTWAELLGRVDAVAGGLAQLGVKRGDTVAIMLGNRPSSTSPTWRQSRSARRRSRSTSHTRRPRSSSCAPTPA
jgi:long-subunit acyl-CoA synthetase (AMP-forming)